MIYLHGLLYRAGVGQHINDFIKEVQNQMRIKDTVDMLDGVTREEYNKLKFFGQLNDSIFEIKKEDTVEEAAERWNQGYQKKWKS